MRKKRISKRFLQEHYWRTGKTLNEIAAELGMSANTVRREVIRHFGETRPHGESASIAYRRRVALDPSAKRVHSDDLKRKISEGQRAAETDDRKARRREAARAQYAAMSEDERAAFHVNGVVGTQQARLNGSRVELGLLAGLKDRGYAVWHRPKRHPGDLYLPDQNACVFVEGRLVATKELWDKAEEAAAAKRALARTTGYKVIRVFQRQAMTTPGLIEELLFKLMTAIELAGAEDGDNYYEVVDGEEEGGGGGDGGRPGCPDGPEGSGGAGGPPAGSGQ